MATEKKVRKTATRSSSQPTQRAVVFQLLSPDAREAKIAGSFNDWEQQSMKRDSKGVWKVKLLLPPGTFEYKFFVDNQWVEDPQNSDKSPSPFGGFNSVCIVS